MMLIGVTGIYKTLMGKSAASGLQIQANLDQIRINLKRIRMKKTQVEMHLNGYHLICHLCHFHLGVLFCFRWNWTNTLDRLRYNREGGNALGWKTQEIFWRG